MTEETIGSMAQIPTVSSDSVKLTKNTKGYSWEIRILSHDLNELERINDDMVRRFGGSE